MLFPIIVLLGLNGLTVGILNAYDQFTIPAIAPLVWNLVIIAGLVVLTPLFEGDDRVYAYAIGVVAGTLVQLLMTLPGLRKLGFPIWRLRLPRRGDPLVRRVLMLMLPVSVGLGLINIDLVLNSMIGSLVSDQAPAAIDKAFRIYMLPQGMFSVAVATVVFPQLSRLASRSEFGQMRSVLGVGMRQIALLLVPAAAATIVLARPIVEVLYQRGEFDAESTDLVTTALSVFAISLPFSGWNLILTRTFFSLQRPWLPTTLAVGSLAVNVAVSLALYPIGIEGVVLGTVVSNAVLTALLGVPPARPAGRAGGRAPAALLRRDAARRRRARGRRLRRAHGARRAARRGPDRADRGARRGAGGGRRRLRAASCSPCASPRPTRSWICCGTGWDAAPRSLFWSWPTRRTSGTSRSSPTSIMGSRRWPTASWRPPTRSTRAR